MMRGVFVASLRLLFGRVRLALPIGHNLSGNHLGEQFPESLGRIGRAGVIVPVTIASRGVITVIIRTVGAIHEWNSWRENTGGVPGSHFGPSRHATGCISLNQAARGRRRALRT
jgi:hypothetical protein